MEMVQEPLRENAAEKEFNCRLQDLLPHCPIRLCMVFSALNTERLWSREALASFYIDPVWMLSKSHVNPRLK